ncbi:hypothetical protein V9T40_014198 [Parthenolecanium corni]|uniref:Sorbitol dehydrogenase n=1 Tax=Parthenolecanium corni TaxID=536013 RepID=A0AAN9TEQ8_9HEMI
MADIKENLAAILYAKDDIRLENFPLREVGDYDVLLEMYCTGICGSDVHYWKHMAIGPFIVKEPMVIGHESSGTVMKAGKNVKNLKPGDRVAVEPGVPCYRCFQCLSGRYNLCPDMEFCATPPIHGNLCRYYVHPANFCFKLPDHVSMEEGALLEPLSCGVHACKRGGVKVGSKVLILGSGPIGLVTLLTAKSMGASKVIVTDLLLGRLEIAQKLGADCCIQVNRSDSEEKLVKCIEESLGGPPDISIDCSGFQSTVKLGLKATRAGGTMVIVGMGESEFKLNLMDSLVREVDIRGIFRYANDYPDALAMVASGQVNVKPLVTHKFKIEETVKAFETAFDSSSGAIKVMIYSKKDS